MRVDVFQENIARLNVLIIIIFASLVSCARLRVSYLDIKDMDD